MYSCRLKNKGMEKCKMWSTILVDTIPSKAASSWLILKLLFVTFQVKQSSLERKSSLISLELDKLIFLLKKEAITPILTRILTNSEMKWDSQWLISSKLLDIILLHSQTEWQLTLSNRLQWKTLTSLQSTIERVSIAKRKTSCLVRYLDLSFNSSVLSSLIERISHRTVFFALMVITFTTRKLLNRMSQLRDLQAWLKNLRSLDHFYPRVSSVLNASKDLLVVLKTFIESLIPCWLLASRTNQVSLSRDSNTRLTILKLVLRFLLRYVSSPQTVVRSNLSSCKTSRWYPTWWWVRLWVHLVWATCRTLPQVTTDD